MKLPVSAAREIKKQQTNGKNKPKPKKNKQTAHENNNNKKNPLPHKTQNTANSQKQKESKLTNKKTTPNSKVSVITASLKSHLDPKRI